MDYCLGMVVRPRAGRDAGRWCVIFALEEPYAWIANGECHPLARPKRKKLLHLSRTNTVLEPVQLTTDDSLKQALQAFTAGGTANQGGQELV